MSIIARSPCLALLGCDYQHMQSFAPKQNSDRVFFWSPLKLITYWYCYRLGIFFSWYFLPGSINLGIDFKISWYLRSAVMLAPAGSSGLCRCLRSQSQFPAGSICRLPLPESAVGFCVCISNPASPTGDETWKYFRWREQFFCPAAFCRLTGQGLPFAHSACLHGVIPPLQVQVERWRWLLWHSAADLPCVPCDGSQPSWLTDCRLFGARKENCSFSLKEIFQVTLQLYKQLQGFPGGSLSETFMQPSFVSFCNAALTVAILSYCFFRPISCRAEAVPLCAVRGVILSCLCFLELLNRPVALPIIVPFACFAPQHLAFQPKETSWKAS